MIVERDSNFAQFKPYIILKMFRQTKLKTSFLTKTELKLAEEFSGVTLNNLDTYITRI